MIREIRQRISAEGTFDLFNVLRAYRHKLRRIYAYLIFSKKVVNLSDAATKCFVPDLVLSYDLLSLLTRPGFHLLADPFGHSLNILCAHFQPCANPQITVFPLGTSTGFQIEPSFGIDPVNVSSPQCRVFWSPGYRVRWRAGPRNIERQQVTGPRERRHKGGEIAGKQRKRSVQRPLNLSEESMRTIEVAIPDQIVLFLMDRRQGDFGASHREREPR